MRSAEVAIVCPAYMKSRTYVLIHMRPARIYLFWTTDTLQLQLLILKVRQGTFAASIKGPSMERALNRVAHHLRLQSCPGPLGSHGFLNTRMYKDVPYYKVPLVLHDTLIYQSTWPPKPRWAPICGQKASSTAACNAQPRSGPKMRP